MSYDFNKRLFYSLFFSFILATIAGTISHESGHYLTARLLGYNARINYETTYIIEGKEKLFLDSILSKYMDQIKEHKDFPGREQFEAIMAEKKRDSFWFLLGGPLQTMVTGTFGLLVLLFYKRRFLLLQTLSLGQWVIIFLALFWLRQPANLFFGLGIWLVTGKQPISGDEMKLANYLEMPPWSILITTAIIGLMVLVYILSGIMPLKERFTFICAGFFGGLTGFILWMKLLGPILMP